MLAEEMDLNNADRAKLRWASLLHDIGKLKISTDILNKPGRLNDDEWVEIKKHPSYGAEICGPILEWLGDFAATIEDHHERFDGNGYPNGKKADEISMGARIVSVADAYDVMTTVRSYKAAMPAAAAREELARNAGGQFDPVVVRAFLNISMGRLRWVAGPLSWLAQLPFLRFVGAVQQVGTAVGVAGVAATGVAAVVAAGITDVPGEDFLELPASTGIQAAAVPGPGADALNDNVTLAEDSSVTLILMANDPGDRTIAIVDDPDFGTIVINEDGSVTYIPADDYYGDDEFTYSLIGDEGETDTAVVSVSVSPVNDSPVALDDLASTVEDTSVTIAVLDNDSDVEALDLGSVGIVDSPINGIVSVSTPTGDVTYTPDRDFSGTDRFRYEVADVDGSVASALVTVEVAPVNDKPVAEDDIATVTEDGSVVVDVVANDTDPEGALDFASVVVVAVPADGSASVLGGVLAYAPDDNYYGPDSFTYEICDDEGLCDSASVDVAVTAVNDDPVGVDDAYVTDEATPLVVPAAGVLSNDSDVDGDPLSVAPATPPVHGVLSLAGDGSFTYTPEPDFNGFDSFTYSVSDEIGGTDVASVTVEVQPKNNAPVAVDDVAYTPKDAPIVVNVVANDTDVEDGIPTGTTAIVIGPLNGSLVNNFDGTFTYTPNADFIGPDEFSYTVDDSEGTTSNVAIVRVTVTPVNQAPVLHQIGPQVGDELAELMFTATASDADVPANTLTFSLSGAVPAGAAINPTTGAFSWTPSESQDGVHVFDVVVTDDGTPALSGSESITVTVNEVNTAPVADPIADTSVPEGTPVSFTAAASGTDLPANTLTWSLDVGPGTIDPATGAYTWTPGELDGPGIHSVVVRVTDDGTPSLFDAEGFEITVTETNIGPVLDPIGPQSADELTAITFIATASDSDVPADTVDVHARWSCAGWGVDPPEHWGVQLDPNRGSGRCVLVRRPGDR